MKVGRNYELKRKRIYFPAKSSLTKIDISSIDMDLPDLKNIFESKSVVIAKWLMSWIEHDLACGKFLLIIYCHLRPNLRIFWG